MKKFQFRLQRIRDLRLAQEKDKLSEFGKEQQKLSDEKQKLELFRSESQTQVNALREERGRPFTVWNQTISHHYLSRIGRVIDYQQGVIVKQSHSVEEARSRYLDAHRDTTILDKLRDKKHVEWTRDVLREEGKLLDEVGSRKQGASGHE